MAVDDGVDPPTSGSLETKLESYPLKAMPSYSSTKGWAKLGRACFQQTATISSTDHFMKLPLPPQGCVSVCDSCFAAEAPMCNPCGKASQFQASRYRNARHDVYLSICSRVKRSTQSKAEWYNKKDPPKSLSLNLQFRPMGRSKRDLAHG